MIPDGITIFGFKIYFYGILIMLGALVATWLSSRRARQYGENPDAAWDILPWALVGGIIGARLWHVFTPPASMVAQGLTVSYYLTHPLEILNFRNGGLGIPGAVIGGFIAVYIYSRRKDMSIANWADIIAPGLALAQGIGRWGNFFNQEVYGSPTNLPWALYIDPLHRLPAYASVERYHPLFLYEFLWNVMNAGLLIWLSKRYREWLRPGDLFLVYLVVYGVGRFLLEFLRLDPSPIGGLGGVNINQTLMGLIALASAVALFLRHRADPRPVAVAAPARRARVRTGSAANPAAPVVDRAALDAQVEPAADAPAVEVPAADAPAAVKPAANAPQDEAGPDAAERPVE